MEKQMTLDQVVQKLKTDNLMPDTGKGNQWFVLLDTATGKIQCHNRERSQKAEPSIKKVYNAVGLVENVSVASPPGRPMTLIRTQFSAA